MNASLDLLSSIEMFWPVWLVCCVAFLFLTARSLEGLPWRRVRGILADEDGAAYTLSYVMIIPLYMLLVCLMVETPLVMSAKLGTVYAAYSGARTASVWSSATSWEKAEAKIKYAALKSFVPFASGTQPEGFTRVPSRQMLRYIQAYELHADDPVSASYVAAKYQYAQKALAVTTDGPPKKWNSDIAITAQYDFPFNVPGIGRILGRRGLDGRYYYRITSRVILQNEGPRNDRQTLGIGYGTFN